jgi:predicted Fe-Mo cluster-binding NifX family protein
MQLIVENLIEQLHIKQRIADQPMKIAIPLVEGKLCTHFGHCEKFAFITVYDGKIAIHEVVTPPPHAPGVIPNWVADQGCTDILVRGMGEAAQEVLKQRGVNVVCGAPSDTAENLVALYLNGNLTNSGNTCDHDHEGLSCNHH